MRPGSLCRRFLSQHAKVAAVPCQSNLCRERVAVSLDNAQRGCQFGLVDQETLVADARVCFDTLVTHDTSVFADRLASHDAVSHSPNESLAR